MFKQKKRPSLHAHRTGSSEAWLRANATRGVHILPSRSSSADGRLCRSLHSWLGRDRIKFVFENKNYKSVNFSFNDWKPVALQISVCRLNTVRSEAQDE